LTLNTWIPLVALAVGATPLVWHDVRRLSVPQPLLYLVLGGWVIVASLPSGPSMSSAALSAGVLTLGAVWLLIVPDSLGEADVLFVAGLAWWLPFWSLLFAVGLACVLGLAAFVWLWQAGQDPRSVAIPYLPCLALGGLGAWGLAG